MTKLKCSRTGKVIAKKNNDTVCEFCNLDLHRYSTVQFLSEEAFNFLILTAAVQFLKKFYNFGLKCLKKQNTWMDEVKWSEKTRSDIK